MDSKQKLSLSADVLRAIYARRAERITLDDLCDGLGVGSAPVREGVRARTTRREDVREIVRRLDEEGFVDAARMRLTLQGFALASSLAARRLVPLHLVAELVA
ncbi:MAG TPA: hypothetical protein VGH28_10090 [Polyangiaceae bacterium]|jgi:DNA-binding GntR family transcriptional regulator